MRALPALLAAVVLAGCGQEAEGLIPADRAELLSATLREAARATAENDCPEARTFTERAATRVANLPASVDDALVDRLEEGVTRLRELVPDECRPEPAAPAETTPETVPETAPPVTTPPPPTTAPPTTTAPPAEETLPPETTPPVPETPVPGEETPGNGNGNGDPNGGAAGEGELE